MPKEFWINVYDMRYKYAYGYPHATLQLAIDIVINNPLKPVYRIHVKMKDNYKCQ